MDADVPVPVTRRDMTFGEIARWAADDSHLLEREMLKAVREVIEQGNVKLKIAAQAVARNQLQQIHTLAGLLSDPDTGLQSILFRNIENLSNREQMELFRIASAREANATRSFVGYINNQDALTVDPDDLRRALSAPETAAKESDELAKETERNVMTKLTALAEVIHAKEVGLVTDPPVVM